MALFSRGPESAPVNGLKAAPLFGNLEQPLILSDQSFLELKVRLHRRLLDVLKLNLIESVPYEQFAAETTQIIEELLATETTPLNDRERRQITRDILDELLGLGPLEPLLKDNSVADILVNTYERVFVERRGRLELSPVRFKDNEHLLRIINKMVTAVGRRIDESQPVVDARLPDGSRINAVIPPIAVDGPLLSVRKFAKIPFDLPKLVEVGTITPEICMLLTGISRGRISVLISGGTGTGKTTLLNAMSKAIDQRERIVTIEDAAELQLQQPHVCRMETRPPNSEGKGEITQRDLVRNALRMRPDRIILGEVRAGEAFDMLQAMNTGHEGSLSTIHANTPRDAISRLEQMIGMAGFEMSPRTIRSQIASAIDVVIQIGRYTDGRRRIMSIQEITGMEGDVVSMNEIFHYHRVSTDSDGDILGYFIANGIRPKFATELETLGITFRPDLFNPRNRLE